MKDGKHLSDSRALGGFLMHEKHFKCSANIYLICLEELDSTPNEKVSALNSKCNVLCSTLTQQLFNLIEMQAQGHIFMCLLLVASAGHQTGNSITDGTY